MASHKFELEYIELDNIDYYYFILQFSDFKSHILNNDRSLKLETKTIKKNKSLEDKLNMSIIE